MNKTSLESGLGLLDNPSESVSKLGVELESIEETGVAAVEKMDSGRVPNLGGQHGHGKPGIPKKNRVVIMQKLKHISGTRCGFFKFAFLYQISQKTSFLV